VRRYQSPVPDPVTGEVIESGYDVLTESWYPNREIFDATMQMLSAEEILVRLRKTKRSFKIGRRTVFLSWTRNMNRDLAQNALEEDIATGNKICVVVVFR